MTGQVQIAIQLLMRGLFPPAFYLGEGLGSFNWLMRTLTGTLFGLATIWVLYPRLDSVLCRVGRRARVELATFAVPPGSVEQRGKAK
ncbi:MAG: hypothetical protein ACE5I2_10860 [Anaerolineae bacterium]